MEAEAIPIQTEADIVLARKRCRAVAEAIGLRRTEVTLVATAISEVVRNILLYAGTGVVRIRRVEAAGRSGIEIEAQDRGPGIADVEQAMLDGFSTGRGLGLGLPGARRLMDDLSLSSVVGEGTTVRMVKWA